MGLGGLGAVAGGLLYLGLVISAWRRPVAVRGRSPLFSIPKLKERHG